MHILNGNLAEGVVETVLTQRETSKEESKSETILPLSIASGVEKAEVAKEIWIGTKKEKPHTSLKFTFSMDQFIVKMFYQAGATVSLKKCIFFYKIRSNFKETVKFFYY